VFLIAIVVVSAGRSEADAQILEGFASLPFSCGRVLGQPDPNEFIVLQLDRPLTQP
jgi:hypothetical protein